MSSDGAGAADEGRPLVPKLRFPEFRGAEGWKLRPLSDVLTEPKEKNRQLEYGPEHVLSVSGEHGCVNQIEYMGRSYAGSSVKEYNVVKTGDIVYTKSPLKACPNGIIKANKGPTGIVSVLYAVYRPAATAMSEFLNQYFSNDHNLNAYLQPLVKKGPKNSILVNNADVLKGRIGIPDLEERQKIADCLSSLDAMIAAEEQRLAALREHKKGLLQALFPAEGQTTPRLRFPEFRDAEEWAVKPLRELCVIVGGGTPDTSREDFWDGGVPWITPAEMGKSLSPYISNTRRTIARAALAESAASLVPSGSVILSTRAPIGSLAINSVPMAFNQGCRALIPNKSTCSYFIYAGLDHQKSVLDRLGAGSTFKELSGTALARLTIRTPPFNEQRKIALCIRTLDDALVRQAQKIDELERFKSAMMQQLFPALAGASA